MLGVNAAPPLCLIAVGRLTVLPGITGRALGGAGCVVVISLVAIFSYLYAISTVSHTRIQPGGSETFACADGVYLAAMAAEARAPDARAAEAAAPDTCAAEAYAAEAWGLISYSNFILWANVQRLSHAF